MTSSSEGPDRERLAWYVLGVSYHLDAAKLSALTTEPEELDPGVLAVKVFVRPDYTGEDVLQFRVVLKNAMKVTKPSLKRGQRLQRIANELRQRVVAVGLPLFASVEFVVKSELAALERRPA